MCSCILSYSQVELFSSFRNVLLCLHCFILSRYIFSLPSFVNTFWFISSSCLVCLTCYDAFFFSFQYIPAFFISFVIFACCRKFLFCIFSRISQPGFEFLFVLFKETPILSLTNFVLTYISSFNSAMFFVEICDNNLLFFFFFSLCLDCFSVLAIII